MLSVFCRPFSFPFPDLKLFFFVLCLLLAEAIAHNAIIQSITSMSSKPSFLVWDKVYRKLAAVEDETWLLRAVEATILFFEAELKRNEQSRSVFMLIA